VADCPGQPRPAASAWRNPHRTEIRFGLSTGEPVHRAAWLHRLQRWMLTEGQALG